MSRPWPDEVRAMADALMRECADPTVVAGSDGTSWVVYARGGSAEYDATVLRSRAHVTIRAVAGNIVDMHTTLPAWSLAQCKRWVEQWVASQADAAVAAYEAAEGMR